MLLTILVSGLCLTLTAQSAERTAKAHKDSLTINDNHVYLSISGLSQVLIYERKLFNGKSFDYNSRIGYGLMQGFYGDYSQAALLNFGFISNNDGKHHFEMQGGAILIYDYKAHRNNYLSGNAYGRSMRDYLHVMPSAYMGYRFQKPNKPFVFRFGSGYPEAGAISFGFSF